MDIQPKALLGIHESWPLKGRQAFIQSMYLTTVLCLPTLVSFSVSSAVGPTQVSIGSQAVLLVLDLPRDNGDQVQRDAGRPRAGLAIDRPRSRYTNYVHVLVLTQKPP